MASSSKTKAEQVRVVVSDDQQQAWVELPRKALPDFSLPTEDDLVAALSQSRVEMTDSVREHVAEYVRLITQPAERQGKDGPPEIPERYLIAQGEPAVDAQDGDFEWDEAFDRRVHDWQGDASVNYYNANSILTVEADTVIGRISLPTEGRVGRDVLGQELKPKRAKGLPVELGEGLATAADDPLTLVTTTSGQLVREGQTLRMHGVLEIRGDVDFKSGNVDSVIDVHVSGDVKPNFVVKTTKSLAVRGSVEAAELDVQGDVQARGGLFGQESGCRVRAGGAVTASICDGVEVEAGGDIRISKEIVNSKLHAMGKLLSEHGSLIGGEVFARNGARIKHAGNEAGVPTRIAVGRDGEVLYRAQMIAAQIRRQTRQAQRIEALVQPLMAELRRLTPAQRERATELTAKVSELELATAELAAQRERMLEESKPDKEPGIHVEGALYPGVVVVFELREAQVKAPVKGPVRIEMRQVKGVTEIAVVNQLTASVTPLPSTEIDVRRFEEAEQGPGVSDAAEQERSDDQKV